MTILENIKLQFKTQHDIVLDSETSDINIIKLVNLLDTTYDKMFNYMTTLSVIRHSLKHSNGDIYNILKSMIESISTIIPANTKYTHSEYINLPTHTAKTYNYHLMDHVRLLVIVNHSFNRLQYNENITEFNNISDEIMYVCDTTDTPISQQIINEYVTYTCNNIETINYSNLDKYENFIQFVNKYVSRFETRSE